MHRINDKNLAEYFGGIASSAEKSMEVGLGIKQERLPIILVIVIVHTIILADNRTPINRSTIIF